MTAPLNPQELYLLERYSSLEYFGRMRDEFAACVKAAENALAAFMLKLPADYRKKPLHDQPDRVWGERIIPNLQWALRGLNDGYIVLSRGQADALGMAGNVMTSFASIQRDYSSEWMPEPFVAAYDKHEINAREMARNINATQQGSWLVGALGQRYTESNRGPLSPPSSWPQYRINPAVRVQTDDPVPRNGLYMPDHPLAAPQFLIKDYEAWEAEIPGNPADPGDQSVGSTRESTVWTLVERIADSGGGTPGADDPIAAGIRLRAAAGESCPREGWWFTPASLNSRRHFKAGDVMPEFKSDYGMTIWQWDETQSS